MTISPTPSLILLLTITIITHSSATDNDSITIVSNLHSLRSQSPSGIIHLNEPLLNRILTSGAKSFHLIIFFDALKLHNQPEPNLKTIKSEFALISKSFIINHQNSSSLNKIFFCDIELNESKNEFLRFGVQSLPDIRIVPPNVDDLKSDAIRVQFGEISGLAESVAEIINLKTKISIGAIHRPPIVSKTQLGFVIGGFVIWLPFLIKKVIAGDTLFHNKKIWIGGTVFVYFFSVSGSMFIIIRRIPLFVMDRNAPNKLMIFFKGHGMQFGAEGVYVGFLFTLVGLLFSFVTRVVVRIKDSTMQRVMMVGVMIVSFWAVKQVVELSHWKTGYAVRAYLPSSWYKLIG